jgi:hypothetical protein
MAGLYKEVNKPKARAAKSKAPIPKNFGKKKR